MAPPAWPSLPRTAGCSTSSPDFTFGNAGFEAVCTRIGIIDLNADGFPDLAYIDSDAKTAFFVAQIGDGGYAAPAPIAAEQAFDLEVAPLTIDGGPQLLLELAGSQARGFTPTDAGPVVAFQVEYLGGPTLESLLVTDLNGDGVPNLAATASDSSVITWLDRGNLAFEPPSPSPTLLSFSGPGLASVQSGGALPGLVILDANTGANVLEPVCAAP